MFTEPPTRGRPSQLSREVQAEICQRWKDKPTYKSLAQEYGCSPDLICSILTDRNKRRKEIRAKKKATK